MTEPFAKVVRTDERDREDDLVVVHQVQVGDLAVWSEASCDSAYEEAFDAMVQRNESSASQVSDHLNTAARKYAADKIREAADFEDGLALIIEKNIVANEAHYRKYPGGKPGQLQSAREKREVAQRLRNHADAVERGEA